MRRDEPVEQVSIRAARPDDRERIVKAFRGLDRGSVYRRFFFHKKELKEEELRRVTECDGVSAAVLVATVGSGDGEIIVGLGEYMRSASRTSSTAKKRAMPGPLRPAPCRDLR
jgi:hypothetical protein